MHEPCFSELCKFALGPSFTLYFRLHKMQLYIVHANVDTALSSLSKNRNNTTCQKLFFILVKVSKEEKQQSSQISSLQKEVNTVPDRGQCIDQCSFKQGGRSFHSVYNTSQNYQNIVSFIFLLFIKQKNILKIFCETVIVK